MAHHSGQIFQTSSKSRWNRFRWTFRILGVVAVFFAVVLVVALIGASNPTLPKLRDKNETYQKILNPENPTVFKTRKNRRFDSLRSVLLARSRARKQAARLKMHLKHAIRILPDSQVRAAFYVPWDPQSFSSLQKFAGQLNVIYPEWIFLNPHTDSLETRIDPRALKIMQDSSVSICPILSNHYSQNSFNGRVVHRILHNARKRALVIHQLIRILQSHHFSGVNLDLEDLVENNNDYLTAFVRELCAALHPLHLTASVDVAVDNEDYDYQNLARYCDYLVVMAYDQHQEGSPAGPVSDLNWVADQVGTIEDVVPSSKIILGMAAYGYDWPYNDVASDLTYQEALADAKQHAAAIQFDTSGGNLHFQYNDDNDVRHDVYFTDAVTQFNLMRFASHEGLAGVALWRLGSEDSRLWGFYDRDFSDSALQARPPSFNAMEHVNLSGMVDFLGDGEIMDVLATPQKGLIQLQVDSQSMTIRDQHYISLPSNYVIRQFGHEDHKVVLTFDDGPDPTYTPQILHILEQEHVPAAFFMIGINAENNIPLVKRIYNDGFEIGNHTFTHPNIALLPPRLADMEIKSTRLLIECITGHSTILFRAPYNADSQPQTYVELAPIALSKQQNYYTINESIDPEDWDLASGVNADSIYNRVVRLRHAGNIILLHDAGGNREATVEALPRIIHYFKSHGYTFTTVGDLMGKTRAQVMPEIKNAHDYTLIRINYWLATLTYWLNHLLIAAFIVGIGLSLLRILILAIMAWIEDRRHDRELERNPPASTQPSELPLVSVIVPAFNEEINVVRTIRTLLASDYPQLDIVFVDDGSSDRTLERVREVFENHPQVTLLSKSNGGKASALNLGVSNSRGEFLICIDADTQLKTDAISQMMRLLLSDEEVGAVAGNVKVGNEVNVLTIWQSIEYVTSQNFDRRAFDLVNSITVVPGAIGAFRKQAILEAGGFTSDTLAEDCDLSIRILRTGYLIRNCTEAISYTEVPETLRMFFKQRFRWTFGVMQSFWKNRDACFNREYGSLGLIALPNILIYQIMLPLLAPLADIIMVFGIFMGNAHRILIYYLVFMLVDAAAAVLAFSFEKERMGKLWWVLPQRLAYRQMMYVILIRAVRTAMKGELQQWGALKRTGRVREVAA